MWVRLIAASIILYCSTHQPIEGVSVKEDREIWLNSTVSTVTSLKKRLHLDCLYIVHCAKSNSKYDTEEIFQLGKSLTFQDMSIGMPDLNRINNKSKCLQHHPLYLMLLINKTARECVQKVTKQSLFSDGLWLVFLDSSTQEVFESLPVPFNSFVVVAHYQQDGVLLEEVYRIAPNLPLIIRRVGEWSKTRGGLSWTQQNVHSRRSSLRGLTLKAVTDHFPPFTIVEVKNNKSQLTGGYIGKVWLHLEKKLQFNTDWVAPPADLYWTEMASRGSGLLQMIPRKFVDAVVSDVTITPKWAAIVDFTMPILTYKFNVFFRPLEKDDNLDWDTYTKPFNLELWISVFGTIVVLAILLSVIHQFGRENGNAEKLFPQLQYSLYEAFFYVLGAFSMQGGDVTPKASSCRIVYFLSFLIAVVLLAAYGGILISFLAIKHEELPFTNLEGILKFKRFQFGVVQNSTEFYFFKDADKNSVQGKIYSTLVMKDPKNCPATDEEAFERICTKRFAFMAPKEYVHHLEESAKCEIYQYQEKHMSASLGIALTRNCEYKEIFNTNLQAMVEGGVLQKMWQDTWAPKPSSAEETWEGVDVNHVTPLLAFFGISILLSLLFLVCERKTILRKNTLPFTSGQMKQSLKAEWKPTPWVS